MALEPYEYFIMAENILRFTGIIHDLVNNAADYLQDIDPKTAESPIQVDHGSGLEDSTVADLKQFANAAYQAAVNYYLKLQNFVDNYSPTQDIIDALYMYGTTAAYMRSKIQNLKDAVQTARDNAIVASTKAELLTIGQTLDIAVPKMVLIRRFI